MQLTEKNKERNFNLVVLIAILITVLGGTSFLLQNDTFYTIKLGERLLNEGMLPIDNFTWHEGIPYSYPHWLYTIFIYLVYKIGGYTGIYISSVILGCIFSLSIYFCYLKLNKNLFVSFLISIAIISMLSGNFTARAQLITYILFTLEIFFIERILSSGKTKYVIYLVLISIAIVNVHTATWFLFFVLLLPYLAEYVLSCFIKPTGADLGYKLDRLVLRKNDNALKLFLIFFICLFTGFLSPIGMTPYTYLINTYEGISVKYIIEHLPLTPISSAHFLLFISSIGLLLVFTKVKLRVCDFFMLSGLLIMALMSIRQMNILFIIGGYILCRLATEFFENNNKERVEFYINKIGTVKGGIITLIFITLLSYNRISTPSPKFEDEYPVQATEYVLKNLDKDKLRIFSSYNYGSYLLFNNIKVFIDSRADLYTIQFNGKVDLFQDYVDLYYLNKNYKEIMAKYPITHYLLNKEESLYIILRDMPELKEIYSDEHFVILETQSK